MMNKQTETEKQEAILISRVRAAEAAWTWCRQNGKKASLAAREMHAALDALNALRNGR